MKIVECESNSCKGIVRWKEDIEEFICDSCDAVHR